MKRKHRHHGGFTIVELLVASTVGLLLVLGVIEAFRQITHAVNKGRANVQLSGKLRNVTNLLREDFRGITVQATPNTTAAAAMGYFEIIEGVDNDSISSSATDTLTGDTDDVIMFTSRRLGEPFPGRVEGRFIGSSRSFENITSPNAEIIYWLEPRNTEFLRDGIDNDGNGITDELLPDDYNSDGTIDATFDGSVGARQHNYMQLATLRRRALLIRPDLNNDAGILPNVSALPNGNLIQFINENDISIRINATGTVSANTLADLTLRKNRIAHLPMKPVNATYQDFPHPFKTALLPFEATLADRKGIGLPFQYGMFMGEDVVMDQVIGFDVRVYDPLVKIVADITGSEPLTPGDPGYETRAHTAAIGQGAYIDLGFASHFTYAANPNNYEDVGIPPTRQLKAVGSLLTLRPDDRSHLNNILTRPLFPPAPFPVLYPTGSNNFMFGQCCVFDTWTIEYERDGVNQNLYWTNNGIDDNKDGLVDGPGEAYYGVVDEGNDGIDNNSSGGIDDILEAETMPPYPISVRGFQVIVRAFQTSQQQTRQFTITHDFTPE
jgi:hypothetical protein